MKIGIVGYGFIGKLHHLAWKSIYPLANFIVIDPNINNETKVQLNKNRAKCFDTFEEALNQSENLNYVSVCSPPNQHREIVIKAAKKGIHILLEKPVATSKNDYIKMKEALSNSSSKLMVGLTQRFYPEVIRAKEWLENNSIGELISIQDLMILSDDGLPPWYYDTKVSGGGILITNGVHILDRIAYLSGNNIEKIDSRFFGKKSFEKIVSLQGSLERGVHFNVHLEWSNLEKKQKLILFGTKGRVELETWNYSQLFTETGVEEFRPYQETDSFSKRTLRGLQAEIYQLINSIDSIPYELTLQGHERVMEHIWDLYNKEGHK